jgi:hypothetical protein
MGERRVFSPRSVIEPIMEVFVLIASVWVVMLSIGIIIALRERIKISLSRWIEAGREQIKKIRAAEAREIAEARRRAEARQLVEARQLEARQLAERKRKFELLVVKTYKGSQAEATKRFQADSAEMANRGYFPTSQSWAPGQWRTEQFILAVVFILIFGLGILMLGYMLIVKPAGILTVTYERRTVVEEKTCPRCAERIKSAALVCHFCGHKFALEGANVPDNGNEERRGSHSLPMASAKHLEVGSEASCPTP